MLWIVAGSSVMHERSPPDIPLRDRWNERLKSLSYRHHKTCQLSHGPGTLVTSPISVWTATGHNLDKAVSRCVILSHGMQRTFEILHTAALMSNITFRRTLLPIYLQAVFGLSEAEHISYLWPSQGLRDGLKILLVNMTDGASPSLAEYQQCFPA